MVSNTAQLRYTATPSFNSRSNERACGPVSVPLRAASPPNARVRSCPRSRTTRDYHAAYTYNTPYPVLLVSSHRGLRLFSERMTLPSSHSTHSAHSPHLPHRASLGIISFARLPFAPCPGLGSFNLLALFFFFFVVFFSESSPYFPLLSSSLSSLLDFTRKPIDSSFLPSPSPPPLPPPLTLFFYPFEHARSLNPCCQTHWLRSRLLPFTFDYRTSQLVSTETTRNIFVYVHMYACAVSATSSEPERCVKCSRDRVNRPIGY